MKNSTCKHNKGGNRLLTIIYYLSHVEEGGETHFPHGQFINKNSSANSACEKPAEAVVRPKKGDALLFYSLDVDSKTSVDAALHEGCPVLQGEKWSATIWVRQADRGWAGVA